MTAFKALVQLLMTVLAAVTPALVGTMTFENWINVIILATGVVMVYNAGNIPGWNYAKLIASAVSAAALVLVSVWQGGVTGPELIQIILAVAAALGVGVVPNVTAQVRTGDSGTSGPRTAY